VAKDEVHVAQVNCTWLNAEAERLTLTITVNQVPQPTHIIYSGAVRPGPGWHKKKGAHARALSRAHARSLSLSLPLSLSLSLPLQFALPGSPCSSRYHVSLF
jgi:hypothetical protein